MRSSFRAFKKNQSFHGFSPRKVGGGLELARLLDPVPTTGSGSQSGTNPFGFEFRADAAIRIHKLSSLRPSFDCASLNVSLWDTSLNLLGRVIFETLTPGEWMEGLLETPVDLLSGTNYILTDKGWGGNDSRTCWTNDETLINNSPVATYIQDRWSVSNQDAPNNTSNTIPTSYLDFSYELL